MVGRITDSRLTHELSEGAKVDVALLKRVSQGDMSAFEELYYRWNKQVYGFMLRTTRSVSDSEDITQEAFVRLWNMRDHIDPRKSIQSLIFTIARRIAVDIYRRSGRLSVTNDVPDERSLSQGESPQEILEEHETGLLLEIAIEGMPDKQRRVFTLYYLHNLSAKEIAEQLGLSYDNVRKHIYNGKRQLREIAALMVVFLLHQQ